MHKSSHSLQHGGARIVHGHPAVELILTLLVRDVLEVPHLRHVRHDDPGRVAIEVDDKVSGVIFVHLALAVVELARCVYDEGAVRRQVTGRRRVGKTDPGADDQDHRDEGRHVERGDDAVGLVKNHHERTEIAEKETNSIINETF
jgi:hypothetical protein